MRLEWPRAHSKVPPRSRLLLLDALQERFLHFHAELGEIVHQVRNLRIVVAFGGIILDAWNRKEGRSHHGGGIGVDALEKPVNVLGPRTRLITRKPKFYLRA